MAAEEVVVEEAAWQLDVLNSNAKNRDQGNFINDSISNAVTRKQIRAAVFDE